MSTSTAAAPAAPTQVKSGGFTAAAANYIEDRTSISGAVKEFGRKIFPDHWSFLLGEVALYSFIVILLTGTFLTFFFQASMAEVVYNGSYVPLKGIHMSAAMESTLNISFMPLGSSAPVGRPLSRLIHTVLIPGGIGNVLGGSPFSAAPMYCIHTGKAALAPNSPRPSEL